MRCCESMWFVINNTRFIFLIQHTLKLSNIRNGLLLNIFLSIVMPGFTSLMESWMPSCFILPLFSINQTVQQVSCVKNRLIRGEFTHLFNLFQSVMFVKNLMTTNYFSAKKLLTSQEIIDDQNLHKLKTRNWTRSICLH